jgi:hypothetical protein
MVPTDNSKWAVLRELALARFPEDVEVADAMRRAEELAVQQPGDPAAFVEAIEALVQANEEKRVGETLVVVNQRTRSVVGSRQAEQEARALAAVVAVYQQKEVVEVAEDVAIVESTTKPFLGHYCTAVDLIASVDDVAMAEAYVVGMVVPQEQHIQEVSASDNIEALFGDSDDSDVVAPMTTDEQVALMASFETAHHEESTCHFMAAEREALAAMLVVRANTAREAARVAAEEETARVAARAAEAVLELTAREEASAAEETARKAARAVARAEELAEEAAAEAAAQEEMARDRRRWDEDMASARRLREVHELATQRRHRRNLARCQAHRTRQAGDEGSNTVDLGWGDDLL